MLDRVIRAKVTIFLSLIALPVASPAQSPASASDTLPTQQIPPAPTVPAQPVVPDQASPSIPQSTAGAPAAGSASAPAGAQATTAAPLSPCVGQSPAGTQVGTNATYHRDDLIAGAEGVFGKGAKGLAKMIESILKKQGEPNAYIAGREASGAFIVGLRYGSGQLCHKVEGQRPIYWTGPSVGFDVGGNATKVFALVYNLYDTQEIYKRYPEIEGHAYYIGGLSATYLRRGHVVVIPVRLGVGLRLGANVGYMKFREKNHWVPF